MALQTISQILSPTNAPYINGVSARLRFSAAVLRNLYQGLIEKDGKGIDDNFVSAAEAEDSAQIFVHRVLPVRIKPREAGASKNGAAYSQNQHFSQTVTVGIDILQIIDDPILIPRFTQDHLPVDLLKTHVEDFSNRLATILNGATFASKILATYLYKGQGKAINETILSLDESNPNLGKDIRNAYVKANGKLDKGDRDNGIDIFPRKTRICIVKVSVGPVLKTEGVLTLGGANEVYAILKNAGVNNSGESLEEDGYVGTIDGVDIHEISTESLIHASEFLGFPEDELEKSPLLGYIASSYANARGVSTSKQTKVVDEVNGQGVRLLPYVKFGVACWYPKGNSILTEKELNFIGHTETSVGAGDQVGLRGLFPSSNITFKVKAGGSRLFPIFSVYSVTTTGGTLTAQALDDWSVDHLAGGYYLETTTPVESVIDFVTRCDGTSGTDYVQKGTADLSVSTGGTFTPASNFTANNYVTVLAIADDGSCSIISKQVA